MSARRSKHKKLEQLALSVFTAALATIPADAGTFRLLLDANLEGDSKPVFLIGRVSSNVEDGNCIVLVNPEPALFNELDPWTNYGGPTLEEKVSGRCDAMTEFWIEAYAQDKITAIRQYRARTARPARFIARHGLPAS